MDACSRNGAPLPDQHGVARLIVPKDKRDGRSLPALTHIELREPGPVL